MPGRNLADFRSGNWNEELGILLLKTLAAVAPIPRQEDFGLDAVATLLRKDRRGEFLYAEDSFYVQFKSIDHKPIVYEDHAVAWLKGLQLPFFIGVVDKIAARLDLYPGHELNSVFISLRNFTKVAVRPCAIAGRDPQNDEHSIEVYLGNPLLSLKISDVSDAALAARFYQLLKTFLRLEQQNVLSRHARFVRHLKWTTNGSAEASGSVTTLSRSKQKDELHYACETMIPGLQIAGLYASATRDVELQQSIDALKGRLTKILTEKEYLDEEKTSWSRFTDPFKGIP